ncbi:MAG: sensor domain-containing diguanylate cyclase [Lachnospiraceae bacterium]|nr:sensor domain-containing diguanylate cyclase [Lachnospiraceae bacterium]
MYHCNIHISFWNVSSEIRNTIKEMEPVPQFFHQVVDSNLPQVIQLKKADFILADLHQYAGDEQAGIEFLLNHKKEDSDLILCVEKSQVESVLSLAGAEITDIWILPLSAEEVKFHFRKWQENKKVQKDLWLNKAYLDTTIDSMTDLVWYKDKVGSHLKVNQSFCEAVGKTKKQVEGRGHYFIWDMTPDEYAKGEYICMESEYEVMDKKITCVFDEKVKTKSGMKEFLTYKSPLFDLDGSIMGTVGVADDVTKERAYERIMKKQANTDFLTGLFNRRYVYQYIEEQNQGPVALFYLDLDNFKFVNDKWGHQQGDNALLMVADVLQERMAEAVVARIGGDEFLVIERKEYTPEEIEEKRIWLEKILNTAFAGKEAMQALSVSIGTAYSADGKVKLDELIGQADTLMYREKKAKKQK